MGPPATYSINEFGEPATGGSTEGRDSHGHRDTYKIFEDTNSSIEIDYINQIIQFYHRFIPVIE